MLAMQKLAISELFCIAFATPVESLQRKTRHNGRVNQRLLLLAGLSCRGRQIACRLGEGDIAKNKPRLGAVVQASYNRPA